MNNVRIGKGKLNGKGVYAARNFKIGEVVMLYNLKKLSQLEFNILPKDEKKFVHSFYGEIYLFPEPPRYTNHSSRPNTESDFKKMCDRAIVEIKKGDMITTNSTLEIKKELETFVLAYEKNKKISQFTYIKVGYRNSIINYCLSKIKKTLILKRIDGNWKIIEETYE